MVDREKVLKGLERCKLYNKVNCDKCPYDYNGRGNGKSECTAELASDALSLLKEQEPRILDWDEIKNYPVVYGEFRDVKEIYPLIITINSSGQVLSWNPGINVSGEFLLLVSDEEDRKNTRCWNKMPTAEQRQAVKWE